MVIKDSWQEIDDIYERYEKLRLSEEIYRTAMGLTPHIISVVDIPNRITYQVHNEGEWSTLTSAMENVPESIIATGIIHPDDCEIFRQYYRDMFAGIRDTGCVIRSKDDKRGWLWFNIIARTIYDEKGIPLRAIVFSDDITDIKTAEAHYEQYKQIVTADAEYVWEANLTRDIVTGGAVEFDELFHQSGDQSYTELLQAGCNTIVDDDLRNYVLTTFSRDNLLKAFDETRRELSCDYPADFHDGRGVRWIHLVHHLMLSVKGEVLVIIAAKDISNIRNNLMELEKKAEEDSLTGLYNRYALKKRLDKVNETMPDATHGFIMFDIDVFKKCNDTFGHGYGDEILCITADVMRKTFRGTDILCRLGGDEYVIFMVNVSEESIVRDKARTLIENLKKVTAEKELKFPINISAGATLTKPGEMFEEIYARIDDALYISKRNGRAQYTFV